MVGGVLFYHWYLVGIGQILPKCFLLLYHSFCSPFTKENRLFWIFFHLRFGRFIFKCYEMPCPGYTSRKPRELTTGLFLKSRGNFVVCLLIFLIPFRVFLCFFVLLCPEIFFYYGQVLGKVGQLHFGRTEILCNGLFLIKEQQN